jgi:SAM-dependent methyltransferase
MNWDLGRPNPRDPWTRFRSYKWLITRRLAAAVAKTSLYARGRLLDVGCGNNRRFAGYFDVETYTGLEYPATLGSDPSPVDVFGTALALPFADGTFDTVVSFETLEHVSESTTMIAEMRRVVKSGGAVIVSVPFLWGEHCRPHDYYRFTTFGLRHVFETVGLRVVHQERVGGFWTFYGQRLSYYVDSVYGRRLSWMTTSLAFGILVCASLLEGLHPVDTEYCMSVIVGTKVCDRDVANGRAALG